MGGLGGWGGVSGVGVLEAAAGQKRVYRQTRSHAVGTCQRPRAGTGQDKQVCRVQMMKWASESVARWLAQMSLVLREGRRSGMLAFRR